MTDWTWTTTQPWAHQRAAFERSKDSPAFALFCEQRTGKSLVVLATAAYLFASKRVDALVVFAPAGVHLNWVTDEVPKHLDAAALNVRCLAWRSTRATQKNYQRELAELLEHPGLAVLTVNYDVLQGGERSRGLKYLYRFLRARKILAVADESTALKNWAAKQTKGAVNFARRVPFRRVLTGTPVTEGPLNLFGQCQFLSPTLLGYTSWTLFKQRYAAWEEGYDPRSGRTYKVQKTDEAGRKIYLHLDELQLRVAQFSFQVKRSDCADLPPTVTSHRTFELGDAQRRTYDALRDDYAAELNGSTLTVANVLSRYVRLQQVASNYFPGQRTAILCTACAGEGCSLCDDLGVVEVDQPAQRVAPENPRLNALRAELEQLSSDDQFIVWCSFRQDVEDVLGLMRELGVSTVRYDGAVGAEDRAEGKRLFQAGLARAWVGNSRASGGVYGLDLSGASTVINYSHVFSLERYLQAIDRAESLRRTRSLSIVNLCAADTVDEVILEAHDQKRALAEVVLGRSRPL